MSRRSLIVMLDEQLVTRVDARVDELVAAGRPTTRDELLAAALERHLTEIRPAARTRAPRPIALDAVMAGVSDRIDGVAKQVATDVAMARRKATTLQQQLRDAAMAGDRGSWDARRARVGTELVAHRDAVLDGFDTMAAAAGQGAQLVAGAVPALADDARSRWMSAQAGRSIAPDRIVRAADRIEAAQATRRRLPEALAAMKASLADARAKLHAAARGATPSPDDLALDVDVDAQTWSFAARETLAMAAEQLDAQIDVVAVGFEHGERLARSHLELVVAIAREVAALVAEVPNLADACA